MKTLQPPTTASEDEEDHAAVDNEPQGEAETAADNQAVETTDEFDNNGW